MIQKDPWLIQNEIEYHMQFCQFLQFDFYRIPLWPTELVKSFALSGPPRTISAL